MQKIKFLKNKLIKRVKMNKIIKYQKNWSDWDYLKIEIMMIIKYKLRYFYVIKKLLLLRLKYDLIKFLIMNFQLIIDVKE